MSHSNYHNAEYYTPTVEFCKVFCLKNSVHHKLTTAPVYISSYWRRDTNVTLQNYPAGHGRNSRICNRKRGGNHCVISAPFPITPHNKLKPDARALRLLGRPSRQDQVSVAFLRGGAINWIHFFAKGETAMKSTSPNSRPSSSASTRSLPDFSAIFCPSQEHKTPFFRRKFEHVDRDYPYRPQDSTDFYEKSKSN